MQKEWYLQLYEFANEKALSEYLQTKHVIYDAGCGLGYKTAWFTNWHKKLLLLEWTLLMVETSCKNI